VKHNFRLHPGCLLHDFPCQWRLFKTFDWWPSWGFLLVSFKKAIAWLKQENFNDEINKYLKFRKFQCNDCAQIQKNVSYITGITTRLNRPGPYTRCPALDLSHVQNVGHTSILLAFAYGNKQH